MHPRAACLPILFLAACAAPSDPLPPDAPPAPLTGGAEPDSDILACVGGMAAWDVREEVEPHIAASPGEPGHLVAAWMVRAPGGPGGIQASTSRDGGVSWSPPTTLAMGECAGGGAGARYTSDPWVAIDGAGRAYISAIEWAPGDDGGFDEVSRLVVARSVDGGVSWERPTLLSSHRRTGAGLDNTAVTASAGTDGTVYVTATRFQGGVGPAGLARSDDGGETWSDLVPTPVPAPEAPISLAPQPLAGSDPEALWIAFGHDPRGANVAVLRSTDGGATWVPPVPVGSWHRPRDWPTYPGTEDELEVAPDIVSAGIDRTTGALWIAHQSALADGTPTVILAGSSDGGATWATTSVLDQGEIGWRPTLAVTAQGNVAVTWYRPAAAPTELRGAGAAGHPTAVDVAWFRPTGGGRAERVARLTVDRFPWAPNRRGAWFLGDYHGLAGVDGGAVAAYSRSTEDGIRVYIARAVQP